MCACECAYTSKIISMYLPTTFTEIVTFGFVPKPLNASHEYVPLCLLWMLEMVSTKVLTLTEGSLRLRPDPSTVNLTLVLGGLPGSGVQSNIKSWPTSRLCADVLTVLSDGGSAVRCRISDIGHSSHSELC